MRFFGSYYKYLIREIKNTIFLSDKKTHLKTEKEDKHPWPWVKSMEAWEVGRQKWDEWVVLKVGHTQSSREPTLQTNKQQYQKLNNNILRIILISYL